MKPIGRLSIQSIEVLAKEQIHWSYSLLSLRVPVLLVPMPMLLTTWNLPKQKKTKDLWRPEEETAVSRVQEESFGARNCHVLREEDHVTRARLTRDQPEKASRCRGCDWGVHVSNL